MSKENDFDIGDEYIIDVQLQHTEPKTPFIVGFLNSSGVMIDGSEIPEEILKVQLINRAIFFKSEFAKESFRIIEKCYQKYGKKLDDGFISVDPRAFHPAIKEIDTLLFELSSILDFLAREINYAFRLRVHFKNISFTRVVNSLKRKHPDLQITKNVVEFSDSETQQYFRKMRNMVTHRLPFQIVGRGVRVFFPDDPESDVSRPSTKMGIDVYETCRTWLYEILDFIDKTSVLVYQKMGKIQFVDKITGKELTPEEYYDLYTKEM